MHINQRGTDLTNNLTQVDDHLLVCFFWKRTNIFKIDIHLFIIWAYKQLKLISYKNQGRFYKVTNLNTENLFVHLLHCEEAKSPARFAGGDKGR